MMTATYQNPYFEEAPPMTRDERENLYGDRHAFITAFAPRPAHKLATKRRPHSLTDIEINHKLRTFVPESIKPKPSDPFKLWVESGRRRPPFPPKWDPEYNSNVWKNFSSVKGFQTSPRGHSVPELIADMYPVKIPGHSRMHEHTFSKFLSEVPIIKDQKRRTLAIARSQRELQDFKQLQLRSEMRVPPMSEEGDILPPSGFKKYKPRNFRLDRPEQTTSQSLRLMSELERDCERSLLGTHRTSPTRLWKLSYKDNHPEYEKVVAERQDQRKRGQKRLSLTQAEVLFK